MSNVKPGTAGKAVSTAAKDGTTEDQRQVQSPRERSAAKAKTAKEEYEQKIADAKKWIADNKDDTAGIHKHEMEIAEYQHRLIDLEVANR